MKLRIGSYEVEVKAKSAYRESRNSEQQAMYFLNLLSLVFSEAGQYNDEHYAEYGGGKYYFDIAKEIYDVLDSKGLYRKHHEAN